MGLKGRFQESRIDDDHILDGAVYSVPAIEGGRIVSQEISAITASNERLRADFTQDSQRGVSRFNKIIAEHGIDFAFTLPHAAFNRGIGVFAGINATPAGELIDDAQWNRQRGEWLPTGADKAYVNSLMVRVIEPGRMASWIAPPRRGIHGQPLDYDYVRFH
jgi:benzoyl-CoA 2,3-dioxygenase component B